MKNYIVAYIPFHDNEMHMLRISAENEVAALVQGLIQEDWELSDDLTSIKAIKDFAFNCDCMIGCIEV